MSDDSTPTTGGEGRPPVLFDVGVIALGHSGTPMSATALGYIREAIQGTLDAVVPYTAVFGAHHVLCNFYEFSTGEATYVLTNFLDARQVHWYGDLTDGTTRSGLGLAGEHNIDGWDGYYTHVARETGVQTVVTIDSDFQGVEGLTVEVPLTDDERAELNEYLA